MPTGARLVSTAWYDNSAENPSNPDAKINVQWGDQTWEEMQYTGFLCTRPQPQAEIRELNTVASSGNGGNRGRVLLLAAAAHP